MALDIPNQLARLRMQTFDQGYRCVAIAPVRQLHGAADLAGLFAQHCDTFDHPVTLLTAWPDAAPHLAFGSVRSLEFTGLEALVTDPKTGPLVVAVPPLIGGSTDAVQGLEVASRLPAVLLVVPIGHVTHGDLASVTDYLRAAQTEIVGIVADEQGAPPLFERMASDLRHELAATRQLIPAKLRGSKRRAPKPVPPPPSGVAQVSGGTGRATAETKLGVSGAQVIQGDVVTRRAGENTRGAGLDAHVLRAKSANAAPGHVTGHAAPLRKQPGGNCVAQPSSSAMRGRAKQTGVVDPLPVLPRNESGSAKAGKSADGQ
ncbi:MAG: hypothetical protein AAFO79_05535 [Pseudomonadota bacterium]